MYAQRLSLDDLQWTRRPFDGVTAYAQTKRMQVVLTELLARRWARARDCGARHAPRLGGHAERAQLDPAILAGDAQAPAHPRTRRRHARVAGGRVGTAVGAVLVRSRTAADPSTAVHHRTPSRPRRIVANVHAARGSRAVIHGAAGCTGMSEPADGRRDCLGALGPPRRHGSALSPSRNPQRCPATGDDRVGARDRRRPPNRPSRHPALHACAHALLRVRSRWYRRELRAVDRQRVVAGGHGRSRADVEPAPAARVGTDALHRRDPALQHAYGSDGRGGGAPRAAVSVQSAREHTRYAPARRVRCPTRTHSASGM